MKVSSERAFFSYGKRSHNMSANTYISIDEKNLIIKGWTYTTAYHDLSLKQRPATQLELKIELDTKMAAQLISVLAEFIAARDVGKTGSN